VLRFVNHDKSLVGLFDYTFTPEGKLRCDADCKMTSSGWTVMPKGCGQVYATEAGYLVHLKSAHIFDFRLGERSLRTWLDRMWTLFVAGQLLTTLFDVAGQFEIVKEQQRQEQLSVHRHLKSNIGSL
jgi:hypothetical protein